MGRTTIRSLGNAGFQVLHGDRGLLLDPFFSGVPGVAGGPWAGSDAIRDIDLILITHDHWDHFSASAVAEAAGRTGAVVAGPACVTRALGGRLPARQLITMEPDRPRSGQNAGAAAVVAMGGTITAFRTVHGRAHNSYLVDIPGLRLLHDGDNEKTGCLDRSKLQGLDAVMLCPWQGSGWVEFLESLRPTRWFLMHMTDEELDAHARGEFFPDLCDHVPAGLVALRPGQSHEQETRS